MRNVQGSSDVARGRVGAASSESGVSVRAAPKEVCAEFRASVAKFKELPKDDRAEGARVLVQQAAQVLEARGIPFERTQDGLRILGDADAAPGTLSRVAYRVQQTLHTTFEYVPGTLGDAAAMFDSRSKRVLLGHRAIFQDERLDIATLHETHHAFRAAMVRRGRPSRWAGNLHALTDEPLSDLAAPPLYKRYMCLDELSAFTIGLNRRRRRLLNGNPDTRNVFVGLAGTLRDQVRQTRDVTAQTLSGKPPTFEIRYGTLWMVARTPRAKLELPVSRSQLLAAYRRVHGQDAPPGWLTGLRSPEHRGRSTDVLLAAAHTNLTDLLHWVTRCEEAFPQRLGSATNEQLAAVAVRVSRTIRQADAAWGRRASSQLDG